VFECANAKLPEGCGNTIHCSGCTIRRNVMDTQETGRRHFRVPAYLNQGNPESYQQIRFLISTEKVEGIVLLRIEEVGNNEED